MAELTWDDVGQHLYETGVRKGVLYLLDEGTGTYPEGVAWNGLTAVTESPSGAEATKLYADDIKYLNLYSAEELGATVEAYTYPDEFALCDGSAEVATGAQIGQQNRKVFGLCYRTTVGNDVSGEDYGYKIHIIYGCKASPSEKAYQTINDSPEAITFSWELTTTPVNVSGYKPTANVVIDSTKFTTTAQRAKLAAFEAIIYGSNGTETYTEFEGESFAVGTTYYERSGTEGSYVYTPTEDQAMNSEKTYYTKSIVGASTARLPLPDEVKTRLTV